MTERRAAERGPRLAGEGRRARSADPDELMVKIDRLTSVLYGTSVGMLAGLLPMTALAVATGTLARSSLPGIGLLAGAGAGTVVALLRLPPRGVPPRSPEPRHP